MKQVLALASSLAFIATLTITCGLRAEEEAGGQDSESKALDATATQWSFQFAYQWMPDYHEDAVGNGQTRPAGLDNYAQLRIVAPIPLKSLTILPRLTIRHYENARSESGFGNTELFGLIIPKQWDWGTGRVGLGPLVTLPGDKQWLETNGDMAWQLPRSTPRGNGSMACCSHSRGGLSIPRC